MNVDLTSRQRIMLAALAAEPNQTFAPVQVQKLFFLMDENLSDRLGGQQFAFEPYDYGPFDKVVFQELQALEQAGFVTIENPQSRGGRRYGATAAGQELGQSELEQLDDETVRYIRDLSKWIRSLGFAQLVGAIYKAFPEMKANSIFSG